MASTALLDRYLSGIGLPFLSIATSAPLEVFVIYLGDGCRRRRTALYATGSPPKGSLGNSTFGIEVAGNRSLSLSYLLASGFAATTPLSSSCNLYMSPAGILVAGVFPADANGILTIPAPSRTIRRSRA
ncbi:MAG: hypothetical protein U1E76_24810 [Planctomycetota bacterium]